MASVAVISSLYIACSSHHVTKKQRPKQVTYVNLDVEGQKRFHMAEHHGKPALDTSKSKNATEELENGLAAKAPAPRFTDERWKNGTWDLNMFVKDGKMDWDAVITAEARRGKVLELYPEAATNQEPVLFRSSVIPWWAWLVRSYLPEAELINGRAAMVGFFMTYFVDALTGLDVVGQTGNFLCKAALLVTVISVILVRRTQDLETLKRLADEATFYDKQWQASWQDKNARK